MAVFGRDGRQRARWLFTAPAIAMLAGCALFLDYTAATGVDVHVVDAVTGEAVPGAKVTLMPHMAFEGVSPRSVVSDARGAAHIDAIMKRSYFVPFAQASVPNAGTLKVEASGYEVYEGPDTTSRRRGDEQKPVQTIRLTPAANK